MTDDDLQTLVADLHAHLAATAELEIDPAANRWLGEAEAVAGDLARGDPDEAVIRERVGHVRRLLESSGETENPRADERVAAALSVVEEIDSRVDR